MNNMTTQRKVRKDFNPEIEYSVNVKGCDESVKREVQQAFFDAGILWENCSDVYKYLGAAEYTNKRYDGVIVDGLMYSYTTEDFSMTAKEFLDIVYESEPEKQACALPKKNKTTVEALITHLSNFPGDMEVLVTDGILGNHYSGVYSVEEFEGCVDIGIGMCMESQ